MKTQRIRAKNGVFFFFFQVICFLALFGGLAMYGAGGAETPSILLVYFGAQTGMNLYMKNVLSKIVVDSEEGLETHGSEPFSGFFRLFQGIEVVN